VKTRKIRGAIRPVAGRREIFAAARSIGVRSGWKAVTIRAVAQQLGYTSPLLYEHFRDKQEILTELAIDGQVSLARGSPKRGNRLSLVNWFVARRAQFWCRRAF
jgi:AcrR family transcriptional regulator